MSSKLEKIKDLKNQLSKKYGKDVFPDELKIDRYLSDSLAILHVLGGLCKGRIYEIIGQNSHGKGLFCYMLTKDVQRAGKSVLWLDFEHTYDEQFAKQQGVDTSEEKLVVMSPNTIEEAFETMEAVAETDEFGLVILDSTSSAPSRAELDSDYGQAMMGSQARSYSQSLKKIIAKISKSKLTIALISQMRLKLNIQFGDPRAFGVGEAIAYYASARVFVKRVEFLEGDNKETVGIKFSIDTNLKNKTHPPRKKAEVMCLYKHGHIKQSEYLDFGVNYGIIDKAGSWFSYGDTKIGQGRDNAVRWMLDNPDKTDEIYKLIVEKMVVAENLQLDLKSLKSPKPKVEKEEKKKVKE